MHAKMTVLVGETLPKHGCSPDKRERATVTREQAKWLVRGSAGFEAKEQ